MRKIHDKDPVLGLNGHTSQWSIRSWYKILLVLCVFFVVQPIMTSPHLYTILFKEQTHIVVKGDTLYSISKFYGVSVEAIVKINKLESRHKIWVGQTLKIPDANSKIGEAETRGSSETVPHIRTLIAPKEDATIDSVRMVQNSDHAGWKRKPRENGGSSSSGRNKGSSSGDDYYGRSYGSSSGTGGVRNNGNGSRNNNGIRNNNPTRTGKYNPTRTGDKQNRDEYEDSPERSSVQEYLYKSPQLTVGPRTDIQLKVDQVRITRNSTMLTFTVKNLGEKSFPVKLATRNSKKAWYLTDRSFDRMYQLKNIKNLKTWNLGRAFNLKARSSHTFIAEFDRIDDDVFYFHLLEGRGRKAGAWNIFDIGLGLNAGNGTDDQWDNRGYTEPESNEDIRDERDERDEKNYEEEYSTYYYVDREQEILDQTDPEVLDIIDRIDDRMRGARRSRESQRVRQNRGRDRVGDSVNSRRKNANSNASNRIREGYGNSRTGSVRNNQERGKRPYVYYYRVKKGDSLDTIAQRYGSTKNELLEINELESDELRIGKIIMVVRRD